MSGGRCPSVSALTDRLTEVVRDFYIQGEEDGTNPRRDGPSPGPLGTSILTTPRLLRLRAKAPPAGEVPVRAWAKRLRVALSLALTAWAWELASRFHPLRESDPVTADPACRCSFRGRVCRMDEARFH